LAAEADNHTQLPAYSGDAHSVIELSHAVVVREMQEFMRTHPSKTGDTLKMYTEELQRIFDECITPEWAVKTTYRLVCDVLPAIIAQKGGYAEKKFR
jgi:hypothetical protein